MPIAFSQIIRTFNKSGGHRAIYEQHTDHLGKIHDHRYQCDLDYNIEQALIDWASGMDARLIEQEKQQVREFISNGGDPSDLSVDYLSSQQTARSVIRGIMSTDDPLIIMPTAEYIDINISDTQLTNWFGASKANRIRTRVNALIANKDFLESDASQVEEV